MGAGHGHSWCTPVDAQTRVGELTGLWQCWGNSVIRRPAGPTS